MRRCASCERAVDLLAEARDRLDRHAERHAAAGGALEDAAEDLGADLDRLAHRRLLGRLRLGEDARLDALGHLDAQPADEAHRLRPAARREREHDLGIE